jgi:predicted dehydrogenase
VLPQTRTDEAPISVGVVGCGNISSVYIRNCSHLSNLSVLACADLDLQRAQERAAQFDVPRACSVEELLADSAIEVVLNLTVPLAHAEISLHALEAGKHVYSEKPLAVTREDAAAAGGLLVGCAPDTILGAGLQTARRLVDDGAIGEPIAATAFFMTSGAESWHPSPEPLYQPGGGPLLDMGPYYLAALVALLGPVRSISSMARISFPERTITETTRRGETFPVTTPSHVAGLLDFASGPVGTMIMSFDVYTHGLPDLEIYGSEGSMSLPDPNFHDGPVRLRRKGWKEWRDVHSDSPHTGNRRGLGLSDMAHAIRHGGTYRATGAFAYHILDVMQAFFDSSETGRHIPVASTCDRPEPMSIELTIEAPDDPDLWGSL